MDGDHLSPRAFPARRVFGSLTASRPALLTGRLAAAASARRAGFALARARALCAG